MSHRAATAMVSAAVLMAPGCGEPDGASAGAESPVRRAAFLASAAEDHLEGCPGAAERTEMQAQRRRLAELRQLAVGKGADQALWLGENDWAAVERYSRRGACPPGDRAYGEALAAYDAALDRLAGALAEYRP